MSYIYVFAALHVCTSGCVPSACVDVYPICETAKLIGVTAHKHMSIGNFDITSNQARRASKTQQKSESVSFLSPVMTQFIYGPTIVAIAQGSFAWRQIWKRD